MGHKKMTFGCLEVGIPDYKMPVVVPQKPTYDGDIFEFDSNYSLSFGTTEYPPGQITWIKPDNMPIFVADRVLLNKISYNQLVREGIASNESIGGKVVRINGVPFCCRLLDVGAESEKGKAAVPNEWDVCLYVTGDEDDLWHWSQVGFWGTCLAKNKEVPNLGAFRGFNSSHFWGEISEMYVGNDIGFRPVLEPLQSMPTCQYKEVTLDAQLFCLAQHKVKHPYQVDFCPVLYPQIKLNDGICRFEGDSFGSLSDGQEVRMYTLVMDGEPVRQDTPSYRRMKYRAGSQIAITDQYYGERYLITWIIHHGCAFAAKEILKDIPVTELIKQGYLPSAP